MSYLSCGNCGSTDLTNEDGVLTCQSCGAEYAMDKSKLKSKEDKELEEEFYSFRKEERKKEINRLINISKKGKSIGKILNAIFPGIGFIYLNKKILGIIFIVIASLIWIITITAVGVDINHSYHTEKHYYTDYRITNYSTMEQVPYQDYDLERVNDFPLASVICAFILILFMIVGYYSTGHIFEPNNTLTDQEVLKYAPDSKRAKKIRARRV